MTYPYVQSYVDLGRAKGPRLAIVWHMAEGGGTVGYLAKPNPNGVSVHFVIEYTGRIVQMLSLDHMQSSIRTSDIRTTDDGDRFYGASAARAVMGNWADIKHGTPGPNHASIGVEMEGFAATGPNALQSVAMARLWRDLSTKWPSIRSLGHRDFADYKACPGKQVKWQLVGGHGEVDTVRVTLVKGEDWQAADTVRLFDDASPDATSPGVVPGGTILRTIGEASGTDGGSWRLTKYQGKPAWFRYKNAAGEVGDMKPLTPGGDPAVDQALSDYIARKTDADENAELAAWHNWYAEAPK